MKKAWEKLKLTLLKFWGKLFGLLLKHGHVAITVTGLFKDLVRNPLLDAVVLFTPTPLDDALLAKAKILAPKIAFKVALALNIAEDLNESESEMEAISKIALYISEHIGSDVEGIFYRELSAQIGVALSDGVVSTAEIMAIIQLIFKKIIK